MAWSCQVFDDSHGIEDVTKEALGSLLNALPWSAACCAKMAQCNAHENPAHCFVFFDQAAPEKRPAMPVDVTWQYAFSNKPEDVRDWLNAKKPPAAGKPVLTATQAYFAQVSASDWHGAHAAPLLCLWWMEETPKGVGQ